MHEIVPDIFTWAWFSEPHGYHFNGYLVRHPEGNLCIDPVPPGDADLAEIVRMGVTKILLTNRNHSRAANVIRERTGARTFIHPDDAAHARSQGAEIDGELSVGEPIGPLAIVAVPGKSPGEVAFRWPERGLLIVGDAVIGNPPGQLRPPARKSDGRSGAPQGTAYASSSTSNSTRCSSATGRRSSTTPKCGCRSWSPPFRTGEAWHRGRRQDSQPQRLKWCEWPL